MAIQSVKNVAFKGLIMVNDATRPVAMSLETDKILDISVKEQDRNNTLITYDFPQIVKRNGEQLEENLVLKVKHNIDTILKAYSAAKNSDLCVDLREYND